MVEDGYGGVVTDTFKITVQVDFIYVFTYVATIGGPIISVLGVIKYFDIFFALFCKRYYRYARTEYIIVDQ